MTLKGHVQSGVVVLDEGPDLPDGTEVSVQLLQEESAQTWLERLKDVVGIADDLPPDMAKNHDHYLHGAPKR